MLMYLEYTTGSIRHGYTPFVGSLLTAASRLLVFQKEYSHNYFKSANLEYSKLCEGGRAMLGAAAPNASTAIRALPVGRAVPSQRTPLRSAAF